MISRELKIRNLPKILVNTANTTAVIMIILAVAGVFSNLLTRLHFQQIVIDAVVNGIPNPYLATLAIMFVLLILGMFIDPSVMIVMFASTVSEAGQALGFNAIHFGILMIVTMLLGAVTPPVGSMLFISCSVAKLPLEKSIRALSPFFLVLVAVTIAILFVPGLSLWINSLVFQ